MDWLGLVILIHILVGFILVYFAARAFVRSKYLPMLYLAFGFFLITMGDTIIGDYMNFAEESNKELVEEITEIAGFVFVIVAVLKS
ncbi:MAG TPA: hypothetical protein VF233_01650 [Nitrososphaeraceae archaeon]